MLYAAGADLVLSGDAHSYERFAPQDPDGSARSRRAASASSWSGTGGVFFTGWSKLKPNSEVRQNDTFGVLSLTLHPTSYEWRFLPEAGGTLHRLRLRRLSRSDARLHGAAAAAARCARARAAARSAAPTRTTGSSGPGRGT